MQKAVTNENDPIAENWGLYTALPFQLPRVLLLPIFECTAIFEVPLYFYAITSTLSHSIKICSGSFFLPYFREI